MNIDKIVKLIRYASGLPKSIYVNFRLLPPHQAIQLPIMVSRKTKLRSLSGKAHLTKIKTGIVRIGFGGTDMLDYRYNRTILKITGDIYFNGKTKIAVGAKINVSGELYLGHHFDITGDAIIICAKKISIGDNTMIAWQSILMDTDQHAIYQDGNIINDDHKSTFTISKRTSWSEKSYNLIDIVNKLPNSKLIKIELQDTDYKRSLLHHSVYTRTTAYKAINWSRKFSSLFKAFGLRDTINQAICKLFKLPIDQSHHNALAQIFVILQKTA